MLDKLKDTYNEYLTNFENLSLFSQQMKLLLTEKRKQRKILLKVFERIVRTDLSLLIQVYSSANMLAKIKCS